jgi:hypothetical protein
VLGLELGKFKVRPLKESTRKLIKQPGIVCDLNYQIKADRNARDKLTGVNLFNK